MEKKSLNNDNNNNKFKWKTRKGKVAGGGSDTNVKSLNIVHRIELNGDLNFFFFPPIF